MKRREAIKINIDTATKIATEVYEGLQVNFDDAEISHKSLIVLVGQSHSMSDGYELAKELEYITSCSIDTIIVDQLDSIGAYIQEHEKILEAKWIQENNIIPKLKIGQEVELHGGLKEIVNIDTNRGYYKIFKSENSSWLVPFEEVEK